MLWLTVQFAVVFYVSGLSELFTFASDADESKKQGLPQTKQEKTEGVETALVPYLISFHSLMLM